MPERFYSVAEANALLPKLRPVLERIRDAQEALRRDPWLAAVRVKAEQNGGGAASEQLVETTRALERDLRQIERWGILLRDPSTGLIDFLHQREGETVFLCWRLGEGRVEWWHSTSSGFSGRQRL